MYTGEEIFTDKSIFKSSKSDLKVPLFLGNISKSFKVIYLAEKNFKV